MQTSVSPPSGALRRRQRLRAGLFAAVSAAAMTAVLAQEPAPASLFVDAAPCAVFGSRSLALPGSDTCLRIGGGVIAELVAPQLETYDLSSRARLSIDSFTPTAFGALHGSLAVSFRNVAGLGDEADPEAATPAGATLSRASLRLGWFTFGRTRSTFDPEMIAGLSASLTPAATVDLAAATLHVAPGLTLSAALE
jgi:hypothetical protein